MSHKALLRILLCALFDTELRHYRCGPSWPAGAVTQIDFKARARPSLRRFADVAHLDGARDQTSGRRPCRAASA